MEKWVIKNKKADFKALMEKHKISEIIARLIINRNQEKEEEIEAYLHADINFLHNPLQMKDINKACDILVHKIDIGEKIRIIGDYDVDGIVSTYVLFTALSKCGAKVDYEIPDRVKDGYGININIIESAYADGVRTIITCDNGISAYEQVKRGKELGMTIIITDHHDVPFEGEGDEKKERIPEADAVINPKQQACNYPWKALCGAAVAYKLCQCLYDHFHIKKKELEDLLEVVSIATVCDVMDLIDENRVIVKNGLKLLKKTKNLGLKALISKNNINQSKLSSYHLGFIIGPCLNASGRLDTAKKGLELLLSTSDMEAEKLADELKKLNDIRKDMTAKGLLKAVELIESSDMIHDKILVVYLNDCHESIAGIIAGRLKDKYYRPAIVLTNSENMVKGSCRSIEPYNIYEGLTECKDLLVKFGGHPMAAGLSLEQENIDELRIALNKNTLLTDEDLVPKVSIDVVLPLGYISENLINDLEILEPFGKGNTKPIFAERNLKIRRASILGKSSNVLKLTVVNEYGRVMDAMYFGDPESFIQNLSEYYGQAEVDKIFQNRDNDIKLSVTYYPSLNEYNGNKNLQIIIQNYQVVAE